MNKKPLILGHRGYRSKYPENTLLSFKKAWEYGADGIECDIQKCSDGTYVVFHDHDLNRITGTPGLINKMPYSKIKKLDAGQGQKIPDLDSFLDSIPEGKFINIELKDETIVPGDCPEIISKLQERSLNKNILISSFRHDLLGPFRESGYSIGMLFDMDTLKPGFFKTIGTVKACDPDYLNLPLELFVHMPSLMRKIFIFMLRKSGRKTALWTLNREADFRMASGFADVIITDEVEQMVELRDGI